MKRTLLIPILASSAVLVGCQNEEIDSVSGKTESNAISFSAVGSSASKTRATVVDAGNLKDTKFYVYAFNSETGKLFMGKSEVGTFEVQKGVEQEFDGTKWNYVVADSLAYWPSDGSKLDFWAINPSTPSEALQLFSDIHGPKKTNYYTFALDNEYDGGSKNYDVMYASAHNYTKDVRSDQKVGLTFHHIFSQVVFKARTAKASLNVEVSKVELYNPHYSGKVTFPTTLKDGDEHYCRDLEASDYTLWMVSHKQGFTASLASDAVSASVDPVWLSKESEPLIVAPQVLSPWTTTADTAVPISTADENKNTYLAITMRLTQNGVYVIGSESAYQTVYVPFSNGTTGWLPGKRYIYTLVFGGGYDSDGKPLLDPITFEPVTSDWVDADQGDTTL